jgi:hypothetical protein
MSRLSQIATTAVLSGALAVAGLGSGLGLGVAVAQGPNTATVYTWCPGEGLPFPEIRWDMNVCHRWFMTPFGTGNVSMVYPDGTPADSFISADIAPPELTRTPPAPLPPGTPFCSPRGSLIIIPPICDEIGVDMPPGSVKH